MKIKRWCKHIKFTASVFPRPCWVYKNTDAVERGWRLCPICGAERPTKSNIAAARLRFQMDNDQ